MQASNPASPNPASPGVCAPSPAVPKPRIASVVRELKSSTVSSDTAHPTDIATLFPGAHLSHVLHVITEPSVAAVTSVIECLESIEPSALEIQSFHVRRSPSAFDQRICVEGIDESHARDIRERLARLSTVSRVRLEHQVKVGRND